MKFNLLKLLIPTFFTYYFFISSTFLYSSYLKHSCLNNEKMQKNYQFILFLSKHFGNIPDDKISALNICLSQKKFFQIQHGAKIRAFYSRKDNTIYIRYLTLKNKKPNHIQKILFHEITHFYLDQKFGSIPYSLSEEIVNFLIKEIKFKKNSFYIPHKIEKKTLKISNKKLSLFIDKILARNHLDIKMSDSYRVNLYTIIYLNKQHLWKLL